MCLGAVAVAVAHSLLIPLVCPAPHRCVRVARSASTLTATTCTPLTARCTTGQSATPLRRVRQWWGAGVAGKGGGTACWCMFCSCTLQEACEGSKHRHDASDSPTQLVQCPSSTASCRRLLLSWRTRTPRRSCCRWGPKRAQQAQHRRQLVQPWQWEIALACVTCLPTTTVIAACAAVPHLQPA